MHKKYYDTKWSRFNNRGLLSGRILSMIYVRLKELRKEKGLTQQQVADAVGKRREVYRRYECGLRPLKTELLIALSEVYDVSTDYILGVTDERKKI